MRRLSFLLVGLLFIGMHAEALAQAKGQTQKTSDVALAADSPLPITTGASLLAGIANKVLTIGVSGQNNRRRFNTWQLSLSGASDDNGRSLTYSTSDKAAPGFKAKIGMGHSSFIATDTATYSRGGAILRTEIWCMRSVELLRKKLEPMKTFSFTSMLDCAAPLAELVAVIPTVTPPGPTPEAQAKLKDMVVTATDLLLAFAKRVNPPIDQQVTCTGFKELDKDLFALCPDGGAPIESVELLRKTHSAAYDRIVTGLPSFYYQTSINWTPMFASANYRVVTNGVPDLATPQHWVKLLQGGSWDTAWFYGKFAGGMQVAYLEVVDLAAVSVCQTTTQGAYSTEDCVDAVLGEPQPKATLSFTTTLALDPLVLPRAGAFARPGAQLEAHYERPTAGGSHKTRLSIPIYLAPTSAPMKLVAGFRPAWDWNSARGKGAAFSLSIFLSARP